jgi:stringent starvation protein B
MLAHENSETTSTRPYLVRALHEWCCDNGLTPFITVAVDASVQVPLEYVKDGEIVLNIGLEATTALRMGNDYIEFKARFSGSVREIMIPVDQVVAIFARENGQGMSFPRVIEPPRKNFGATTEPSSEKVPKTPPTKGKPSLTLVK